MLRATFAAIFLLGLGLNSKACGEDEASHDIVDTAIAAGSFKTLVQAVDAAGLTEVLKSPGPFTVLAPNDEAFAALPKGTLEDLLKDKQKLASMITYHFIPGKAMSTDLMKLESAKSAQGELLAIKAEKVALRVNSAKVLKADILCSNGVIHVIDTVLIPPRPTPPVVKQAKAALQVAAEIEPAKRIAELKMVLGDVLKLAHKNVLAQEALEEALAQAAELEDEEATMLALREGLRDAVEILEFTPFQEAKLPQGFPELTPVGEIQVKTYPKYRMARVEMEDRSKQGRAFFTLFQHIVRNRIEMTAPVEMTYNSAGPTQEAAMAFLYESTEIGTLGESGKVQVSDVPEMMAVSLGVRGDYSGDQVAKGEQYLQQWLKRHVNRYEAAGNLRVLGYNSPFLPAERRYAEVQLPLRYRDGATNTSDK
jgi:uncharacterized surface protein with fasciclin (FAS1) repeats